MAMTEPVPLQIFLFVGLILCSLVDIIKTKGELVKIIIKQYFTTLSYARNCLFRNFTCDLPERIFFLCFVTVSIHRS
jgi:hypothetical protein